MEHGNKRLAGVGHRKFNALVRFFKLLKCTKGWPVPDMPEIPPPPPPPKLPPRKRAPTGKPGCSAFVSLEMSKMAQLNRIEEKLDQLIESNI